MSTGQIKFAVQCRVSKLFLSNFTPCRAAIEVTPVEKVAQRLDRAEAGKLAESLKPLFGTFDFHPVRVDA